MPNGITMPIADMIIQHHGHDAYRRFRSQHTPVNGYDIPHFPQYAVVQCADCSSALHHERMNYLPSYDTRYSLRIHDPATLASVPVLQGNREYVFTSVCPSCTDECEWCEEPVRLVNTNYSSIVLCPNCEDNARECAGCGDMLDVSNGDYYTFEAYHRRDDYYCHHCYENRVAVCENCDESYHEDDEAPCECNDPSSLILNYSAMRDANDRIFFVGMTGDRDTDMPNMIHSQYRFNRSEFVHEPMMGFECETEAERNDLLTGAQFFQDVIDQQRLYLKEDGSLRNGFEIVTQPHTLDMYQNHFDWSPFKQLSEYGFRSYKYHDPDLNHDVGFHIHINRNAFYTKRLHERTSSSPHLYGFLSFIYHNVPSMTRISSRNSHYGSITENELDNIYGYARHRSYGDRSVAVNCRNQHTIELRCFAGALNPNRALGYLEFTHALWAYTKSDRIGKMKEHHKMDFNAFADWVEHDPKYSHLVSLINRSNARLLTK
jgi:hypothetical protein